MNETIVKPAPLSKKDFISNQEVRWCPGCGDYAILSQVQKVMPELGLPKENIVIISGIGCSSRFPYYMNTYGFHSIHGRAPALASGIKLANPDLSVWVITGDGDSMAIGGNHLIHILRRNMDVNILLFNNEIYGLTKGQYSPTSELGKVTKSSPFGSIDYPFNPPQLALGAAGTFIARGIDREQKHLQGLLRHAHTHTGTSFVEIYQNCLIFNNGVFSHLTEKEAKAETVLVLEEGEPMIFGKNEDKGLRLNGSHLEVIQLDGNTSHDHVLIHDETNKIQALLLSELTYLKDFPTPIGVFYHQDVETYNHMMIKQIEHAKESKGEGDIEALFREGYTWTV